ncbi:MAG: crotonobetainyl-CoA--carnitine CoA-transferase [Nitrospiraceae bacterium]|nr:MAG: crotonobetainyl-CoA--carnitine CoA-transferase [Nitrospiraceae bacterium]
MKPKDEIRILGGSTEKEKSNREHFVGQLKHCPIPDNEILDNLGLFLRRQTLSRILFMHELYRKILDVHGVVIEFGVRWGQNLALFESFRGMYEPYNYNRKVIGFDTFTGFPQVDQKDGGTLTIGDYGVTEGYESFLEAVLKYHESESPIAHIKKFELIKGDATETIETYLEKHPETVVALAYFDFDIYLPTKKCLMAIKDRLTRGSILAFDELNCPQFPGETIAFKEVFGIDKFALKRNSLNPLCSYVVID